MSLNIKDKEAHELARRLAEETGETMTRAVIEALRERLTRVRRRRKSRATTEDLLNIGKRCAARLHGPLPDHGAMLYDQRGLPK